MVNRMKAMTEPTNGAAPDIECLEPFTVRFTIQGTADMIFHRWNCEAVEEKARASKGSKAKKTDNIESYVYRDDKGVICLPGEYVRQAILGAARSKRDPRSPRKMAVDLYKAGVVPLTVLASLGKKQWDYEDKRRVVVNRAGINRVRPAFVAGWRATLDFMVLTPEYISEDEFRDVVQMSGKFVGVAEMRPTFGRYDVVEWKRI